jgi:nucleoside diphosphate kinase
MSFFQISTIIAALSKMGAAVTEKQLELLKWRLSEEAQKFYTVEETNRFYEALKKGDTSIIDVVRFEKQNKINELKSELEQQL